MTVVSVFSCKLAKYHSGSVYFKCCSRFQNLFSLHACSVSCTSGIRSKLNNQKRNCIATKNGGNTTSPFQPRRFLPQIVSCSEKRRRPEAGVRFECVKPVYRNRALQNGKFSNIEVSPLQGRLYDKFRPHRRLPDGSHASRLPKISSFSVGGQNLRIYSNAIRPKCGPQAVYKNHEAGCSLTEESRGSSDHLSRRHFNCFFNRDVESPQNTSHQLARIPRFSNKLREVECNSIPTNCVLGNAGGFGVNAIHITPTESCTDSKRMSPPPKHKQANYSPFVSGPRTSRGMSPSRMVCPTSLPSTANSSDKRSSEMGELQRPGGFDTIGQIRPIMVGNDPTNPARESNCSANCRLNHLLGCFQTGMGASWGSQRTGGLWSEKESQDHINVLELRAAFFALKSFLPTQTNKVICLKLDNTTAVSYLNNLGGTHCPQLLHLAIAIWDWCEKRHLFLLAQHIPGKTNVEADTESRVKRDLNDWRISPKIIAPLIRDCTIDLFASRLTHQLKPYFSWRPDPSAVHNDAFTMDWLNLMAYAFPPFNLIPSVLQKAKKEHATLVLVAPLWTTKPWWPLLIELIVNYPVYLGNNPKLLQDVSSSGAMHPLFPSLKLAVWRISGNVTKQWEFQKKLSNSSATTPRAQPPKHTMFPGLSGVAGVRRGIAIPYHVQCLTF